MPSKLCRWGFHKWRKAAAPLSEWQEDMLRHGHPVRREWVSVCARKCGASGA